MESLWLSGHRSVKSEGLRFDSSWGLRIFSLSHGRDKTKNPSLNQSCYAEKGRREGKMAQPCRLLIYTEGPVVLLLFICLFCC